MQKIYFVLEIYCRIKNNYTSQIKYMFIFNY